MKLLHIILPAFTTFSCVRKAPPEEPPKTPYTFDEVADRVIGMMDNGWVVSRWDGTQEAYGQGDSLIFTGIALGVLDCARAKAPEDALLKMLTENHGALERHPSLPNDWSLDGALGLYYGISTHVKKCPGSVESWRAVWPEHMAAVTLPPYFWAVQHQVAADLGLEAQPTAEDRGALGAELAGWGLAVVSQRAAAYRLHLAFLAFSVVDAPKGKDNFCQAVAEAKMPLLEHFCGRSGLSDWVAAFQYDVWQYAHQRSPVWEGTPDGRPGLHQPGLDYLIAVNALSP